MAREDQVHSFPSRPPLRPSLRRCPAVTHPASATSVRTHAPGVAKKGEASSGTLRLFPEPAEQEVRLGFVLNVTVPYLGGGGGAPQAFRPLQEGPPWAPNSSLVFPAFPPRPPGKERRSISSTYLLVTLVHVFLCVCNSATTSVGRRLSIQHTLFL